MTLSSHLNSTLEHLLSDKGKSITNQQLISCIDLTLLAENASTDDLNSLKNQAARNKVAAVCVAPHHLSQFTLLDDIKLATVINFPSGNEAIELSLANVEKAIASNAEEIDYVFPYQSYRSNKKQNALTNCERILNLCHAHGVTVKIILETGVFSEIEPIYHLAKELIHSGCNFLKTSTGKIPEGASLSAAMALLSAIKDTGTTCGIKISGGIKTPLQARNYASIAELVLEKNINKEWFRIGASSLLGELLNLGYTPQ